jgi:hypothetical protein
VRDAHKWGAYTFIHFGSSLHRAVVQKERPRFPVRRKPGPRCHGRALQGLESNQRVPFPASAVSTLVMHPDRKKAGAPVGKCPSPVGGRGTTKRAYIPRLHPVFSGNGVNIPNLPVHELPKTRKSAEKPQDLGGTRTKEAIARFEKAVDAAVKAGPLGRPGPRGASEKP